MTIKDIKLDSQELYYTGIGSRKTPEDVLLFMTNIAVDLENIGFILRSGGANGADGAFAKGCTKKEIYIPWKGFNNIKDNVILGCTKGAELMASVIHPYWHNCSHASRKLHSRNIHEVLGKDLTNEDKYSKLVICWTPKGEKVGGTATAIELAERKGIPVCNLFFPEDKEILLRLIDDFKENIN